MSFGESLAIIAPWYNLGFVIIALILFIKLFKTKPHHSEVYFKSWRVIFLAMFVFIIEEVITVIRSAGIVTFPLHINGYFELVITALIIYALLSQRDYVRHHLM